MKGKGTYLFLSIFLFLTLIAHVSLYFNSDFFWYSTDVSLYVFYGVGALVFISSFICFVNFVSWNRRFLKHLQNSEEYILNLGDSSQEVRIQNAPVLQEPILQSYEQLLGDLEDDLSENSESQLKKLNNSEQNLESESSIDYNQLEEMLLSATKMEVVYDVSCTWLTNNLEVSYAAFTSITNNDKLSVEFYKETCACNEYLVEAVIERTDSIGINEYILHSNHTVSYPYYKKGEIVGFVFLGYPSELVEKHNKYQKFVRPFIRILSTACLLIELAKTKEQRSSLQKAFSSYVPSAIVDLFEHDPSVLKIGGEYENLTIMFTDLKEFTTLSETMSPDVLVTVLNEYFSEMSGVIETFGGTVSKLVGDGILAFFGGPNSSDNHAEKCCEAALTMKKYERLLNDKLMGMGKLKEPLFTRIGISTGKVILGNIGSEKRLDYTVIGPEVNLASRIEEANKKCDTSILMSYQTFLEVRNTFDCRRVAFMKLKGFSRSVYLFEPLGKKQTELEQKQLLANDVATLLGLDSTHMLHPQLAQQDFDAKDVEEARELSSVEELEEFEDADEL